METDILTQKPSTASFVLLSVISGLFMWLCLPIMIFMWTLWFGDIGHNNGVLMPLVSLYLIWSKRDQLKSLEAQPSWWGLLFLFFSVCVMLLGIGSAERFTQEVAMVMLLIGIVWFNLGNKVSRAVTFPMLFLFLMIPPPMMFYAGLSVKLQLFSTKISMVFLHLLNIPVYNEGNVISLPSMQLQVAEACSGIRSLFSLFTLGVIFAYLFQRHWTWRLILILSTIPIAILFNALRISGTCILAQYWSPKITDSFNHFMSGWIVFIFAFLALWLFNTLIDRLFKRV
ncbi:MAG: exosortase [Deltaproteobacteria bacterium]|nr:exosortase [Deltaproteobacteria bacterium]